MKRVVIYGAGEKGIFLNRLLAGRDIFPQEEALSPVFFCDTYKKAGSYVDGMEVIPPGRLGQLEEEIDGIVISAIEHVDEIQKELIRQHVRGEVSVVPDYVFRFRWDRQDMPFLVRVELERPRMPYLEIKVVDHCNLNCKGCSALANISAPRFADIGTFESDLRRLKELFWGIKYLKLFGGEPLLHPELEQLIALARRYFPDAVLVVHSNGLLVPGVEESLLRLMKLRDVAFEFTQYPPTGLMKRRIQKVLDRSGVAYRFREALYEFRKAINLSGDYEEEEIYKDCCKCVNLINGTLSCGVGWMIKGLEEKYDVEICEDKFRNCVDIYETDMDGWQINRLLDSPYNLCRYCAFMDFRDSSDDKMMKWSCAAPYGLSDWTCRS